MMGKPHIVNQPLYTHSTCTLYMYVCTYLYDTHHTPTHITLIPPHTSHTQPNPHLVHGLHAVWQDADGQVVPLAQFDHTTQCLCVGVTFRAALQVQLGGETMEEGVEVGGRGRG